MVELFYSEYIARAWLLWTFRLHWNLIAAWSRVMGKNQIQDMARKNWGTLSWSNSDLSSQGSVSRKGTIKVYKDPQHTISTQRQLSAEDLTTPSNITPYATFVFPHWARWPYSQLVYFEMHKSNCTSNFCLCYFAWSFANLLICWTHAFFIIHAVISLFICGLIPKLLEGLGMRLK